jgi:hypothetical protein
MLVGESGRWRGNTRRMLVGTWADADWAIRFLYLRHGFELVALERKTALLRRIGSSAIA